MSISFVRLYLVFHTYELPGVVVEDTRHVSEQEQPGGNVLYLSTSHLPRHVKQEESH